MEEDEKMSKSKGGSKTKSKKRCKTKCSSGSKTKSKGVSKKQQTARAKFKKAIAKAKQIRKTNPSMKWSECVKRAFKKV